MEKADEIFCCFRCGTLECIGDTERTITLCDDCGKIGVLSIETALDIINNLYLDRELPEGLMELIDDITEDEAWITSYLEEFDDD